VETGKFDIMIGGSSQNITGSVTITVESTVKLPVVYTMDSTIGDLMEDPFASQYIGELMKGSFFASGDMEESLEEEGAISKEMMMAMMKYMPIRGAISFGNGTVRREDLLKVIDKLNNRE
jgi:beta-glucosidase